MKTGVQATASSVFGLIVLSAVVFLPASTLNYWQAWGFIATFMVATIFPSIYVARTNPAALQRRMHGGPRAEARTIQKILITGAWLGLFALLVISAYDHRMGWSSVPAWVCSAFGCRPSVFSGGSVFSGDGDMQKAPVSSTLTLFGDLFGADERRRLVSSPPRSSRWRLC